MLPCHVHRHAWRFADRHYVVRYLQNLSNTATSNRLKFADVLAGAYRVRPVKTTLLAAIDDDAPGSQCPVPVARGGEENV